MFLPDPPGAWPTRSCRVRHVQFRLWQVEVTALTVLLTCWLVTCGPLVAIMALMGAKHVLVALLMAQPEPPADPAEDGVVRGENDSPPDG